MDHILVEVFKMILPHELKGYRDFYDRKERDVPFMEYAARLHAEKYRVDTGLADLINKVVK